MKRLKTLRDEKKMSQLNLAMKVGTSQESISGYETGKAVPPADMLIKLADFFNTTVDYLLERSDERNSKPIMKSDLTKTEQELFETFRALPKDKQERALGIIIGLKE